MYVDIVTNLYSNHISKPEYVQEFAQKQLHMLEYAADRNQLKKYKTESTRVKRSKILTDPVTVNLINRFLYMKRNGILEKILLDKT